MFYDRDGENARFMSNQYQYRTRYFVLFWIFGCMSVPFFFSTLGRVAQLSEVPRFKTKLSFIFRI